jgi:tRNA-binding EMAP/Myf-like protein
MYRLFYDYEVNGDVLFILMDPEKKVTKCVRTGQVAALYNGEELIGINVFEVSSSVKIKATGMIATPSSALIDVLNPLLKGAGLAPLPYCTDSGYHVAEITALEEHPVDEKAHIVTLSLGEKTLQTVSHYQNLTVGALVVAELEGCIAYDGTVFHEFTSRNIKSEASICSAKELKVAGPEQGAFLVEGYKAGEDFYLGGH